MIGGAHRKHPPFFFFSDYLDYYKREKLKQFPDFDFDNLSYSSFLKIKIDYACHQVEIQNVEK